MKSLLDQLKQYSTVVADTGDLDAIRRYRPVDATTNPSLVLKAVESGRYETLLDQVIAMVRAEQHDNAEQRIRSACDHLTVGMGKAILQHVPGRVSTEVNADLSFDTRGSLDKARHLIALYENLGIGRDRVLIKLAATWEGIAAAELLEKEGIQCNLTLIFSFVQARACAEAGVYLISPFVGRILDWYRKAEPERDFSPEEEPGVRSVSEIYRYFRSREYDTIVMGASFRNAGEILALAGCDRLTISPALLEALEQTAEPLEQKLHDTGERVERPARLTESEFRWAFNEDTMATEKLAEGIRGFAADQHKLEALLRQRLA
ncbi:transaldolase [Natronospirillum operosum]|uniref:Transaldolase n=1 Tax=Natronospirillum operosum TaxID=2759953 RepID=A0A4Z0W558_9GAMM|nr:transaldolase [Natronospirillum operosum]TGG90714.1 transaldolase [Natronospirillum operosum]